MAFFVNRLHDAIGIGREECEIAPNRDPKHRNAQVFDPVALFWIFEGVKIGAPSGSPGHTHFRDEISRSILINVGSLFGAI